MTTKTYTIEELCRLLGIDGKCCQCKGKLEWDIYASSHADYLGGWCDKCKLKIEPLRVGDHLPSEEHKCDGWACDLCEKKTCVACGGVMDYEGNCACKDCKEKAGIKELEHDEGNNKIEKLPQSQLTLLTVKSLRLVEMCECGHHQAIHIPKEMQKQTGGVGCEGNKGNCLCEQFKPVQMVEITTEG